MLISSARSSFLKTLPPNKHKEVEAFLSKIQNT